MRTILAINAGSSSVRFAYFDVSAAPRRVLGGKLDRIGGAGSRLVVDASAQGAAPAPVAVPAGGQRAAVVFLWKWLSKQPPASGLVAVGHRVVHGMQRSEPARVTPDLLAELKELVPYDPEHLPREIELIETVHRERPDLAQAACFDTAFHRSMPRIATVLPIPRRYQAKGVQRYGFHGLSYTFLMAELGRVRDPAAAQGRVILAHLGNGASLAAVRDGRCIDTSMAFTPAAGLVMSTRSGDLDPGLMSFLAATERMDIAAYEKMVNHESGLLGISETSSDLRDLLAHERRDERAAEAVAIFCYQVRKWIGAFAAALGGLDTLVFAGGIGENSPVIRARICEGLQHLGVVLDGRSNEAGGALISAATATAAAAIATAEAGARVRVRVIRTDEESVIAASTLRVLDLAADQEMCS